MTKVQVQPDTVAAVKSTVANEGSGIGGLVDGLALPAGVGNALGALSGAGDVTTAIGKLNGAATQELSAAQWLLGEVSGGLHSHGKTVTDGDDVNRANANGAQTQTDCGPATSSPGYAQPASDPSSGSSSTWQPTSDDGVATT